MLNFIYNKSASVFIDKINYSNEIIKNVEAILNIDEVNNNRDLDCLNIDITASNNLIKNQSVISKLVNLLPEENNNGKKK